MNVFLLVSTRNFALVKWNFTTVGPHLEKVLLATLWKNLLLAPPANTPSDTHVFKSSGGPRQRLLRGVWCAGLFCNAHVFTTNFGLSRNCYFYCTTPICLQHTAEYRVSRIIADLQSHVTNCDVIMKLDFDHKTCRPIVLQPALT